MKLLSIITVEFCSKGQTTNSSDTEENNGNTITQQINNL
jgi:hypothetical protein